MVIFNSHAIFLLAVLGLLAMPGPTNSLLFVSGTTRGFRASAHHHTKACVTFGFCYHPATRTEQISPLWPHVAGILICGFLCGYVSEVGLSEIRTPRVVSPLPALIHCL